MKKLNNNDGKINIVVIILLVIIVIAGVILALKITGVIQPEEKDYTNTTNSLQNSNSKSSKGPITFYSITKAISKSYIIGILIFEIAVNIGICKLYQKLQIPKLIIVFNFLWPILNIIRGFFDIWDNWFGKVLSIIYYIMQIASLYYYFDSVGMSVVWAFIPTISTVVVAFGSIGLVVGSASLGFLSLIGLIGIMAFLIAYVISNIKLAKIFGKGTGFTIGLALVPIIFQPILGYSETETPTYRI